MAFIQNVQSHLVEVNKPLNCQNPILTKGTIKRRETRFDLQGEIILQRSCMKTTLWDKRNTSQGGIIWNYAPAGIESNQITSSFQERNKI